MNSRFFYPACGGLGQSFPASGEPDAVQTGDLIVMFVKIEEKMKERLIISNFTSIKALDVTFAPINILIGPQASGKSITAKLFYYFKEFPRHLFQAIETNLTKREFEKELLNKFEEYFPIQNYQKQNVFIRYEYGDFFFELTKAPDIKSKLRITYSDELNKERLSNQKYYKRISEKQGKREFDPLEKSFKLREHIYESLKKNIGENIGFNQIFIPAGRSFFANLQSSIFSFLSSNKAIDPFITEFGSFYERIKDYPRMERLRKDDKSKLYDKLKSKIEEILKGQYIQEKGKDLILHKDDRKILVSNASSGQQEMLPLATMLGIIPFIRFLGNGQTIYIEEPEAHLFPSAQKDIVELIVGIFNQTKKQPLQFFITTHSPYILTSFNNLVHAGLLESTLTDKTELLNIISKDLILNPQFLNAYSLSDGQCKSIMCEETGLISTNIIDQVSDDISIQFDQLLNI
ncbi:MAG: AAA family ATPase [Ignavibacteriales bacterium]|nr:AAA family ATPase [Ignavibacteriales bacterium]